MCDRASCFVRLSRVSAVPQKLRVVGSFDWPGPSLKSEGSIRCEELIVVTQEIDTRLARWSTWFVERKSTGLSLALMCWSFGQRHDDATYF